MSYVSVYAIKTDGTHHLMLSMICTERKKPDILESNCEAIDSSCPSSSGFSQLPYTGGFKEMLFFSQNWGWACGTIKDTEKKTSRKEWWKRTEYDLNI